MRAHPLCHDAIFSFRWLAVNGERERKAETEIETKSSRRIQSSLGVSAHSLSLSLSSLDRQFSFTCLGAHPTAASAARFIRPFLKGGDKGERGPRCCRAFPCASLRPSRGTLALPLTPPLRPCLRAAPQPRRQPVPGLLPHEQIRRGPARRAVRRRKEPAGSGRRARTEAREAMAAGDRLTLGAIGASLPLPTVLPGPPWSRWPAACLAARVTRPRVPAASPPEGGVPEAVAVFPLSALTLARCPPSPTRQLLRRHRAH